MAESTEVEKAPAFNWELIDKPRMLEEIERMKAQLTEAEDALKLARDELEDARHLSVPELIKPWVHSFNVLGTSVVIADEDLLLKKADVVVIVSLADVVSARMNQLVNMMLALPLDDTTPINTIDGVRGWTDPNLEEDIGCQETSNGPSEPE